MHCFLQPQAENVPNGVGILLTLMLPGMDMFIRLLCSLIGSPFVLNILLTSSRFVLNLLAGRKWENFNLRGVWIQAWWERIQDSGRGSRKDDTGSISTVCRSQYPHIIVFLGKPSNISWTFLLDVPKRALYFIFTSVRKEFPHGFQMGQPVLGWSLARFERKVINSGPLWYSAHWDTLCYSSKCFCRMHIDSLVFDVHQTLTFHLTVMSSEEVCLKVCMSCSVFYRLISIISVVKRLYSIRYLNSSISFVNFWVILANSVVVTHFVCEGHVATLDMCRHGWLMEIV